MIAIFLTVMFFSRAVDIGGDSSMYADDVATSLGQSWSNSPQIWNFAHLIWRPIGRLLAEGLLGMVEPFFNHNVRMSIAFLLMALNFMAALIGAMILQKAIWRMTANRLASLLMPTAFLCLNPVLHYSRLASPYIVGIALVTLATYLVAFCEDESWRTAVPVGIASGVAVLLWAPFLLCFPGVLFSGVILRTAPGKRRFPWGFAVVVCVAACAVSLACYGMAMHFDHIGDRTSLLKWVHESAPDSSTLKPLRLVNAMGRGFYEMGRDSVWLKWYVFHDPYAKVRALDLVTLSVTELVAFYMALLALILVLIRTPKGRRVLTFVAVATLPHLGLALFYENGSVERYLGFLPAMIIGFGYAVGSAEFPASGRAVAAILACLPIPANLATAAVRNVDHELHQDPDRLSAMTSLHPPSRLFVLTSGDPLFRLSYSDPLNGLHKENLPLVNTIAPFASGPRWRSGFACVVLSVWNVQGETWITKRVLAAEPKREWMWVEGDPPGMKWRDFVNFFADTGKSVQRGGEDGFFKLQDTAESRTKLLELVPGKDARACPPIVSGPSSSLAEQAAAHH